MTQSKWAGASFDILKQIFECLPGWSSGPSARKRRSYLLVCKHWVAPACSAVKHVALKGTDAQLQAVLDKYPAVCSLDLTLYDPKLSAGGLASLIYCRHLRSLSVLATDISSLELVHTLTHLEELEVNYGVHLNGRELPHLPCTDFSRLTFLKLQTESQEEPPGTFLYLTQLQTLRHLTLCTAAPSGFKYAALSLLTSLSLDRLDLLSLEDLEGLQDLPQLVDLDLTGHPSDADILMLANLTKLTALIIETIDEGGLECHLSSVVMLSSLVNLESFQCEIKVDGVLYGVYITDDLPGRVRARMVVSTPDAPFTFALC